MKIKFLGTGTSHGVPVIGCNCGVCGSGKRKNKRYRSSVLIREGGTNLIIDMPAEFRIRSLEYKIDRIDAALFTHPHADHTAGLDDIRRYNELQGKEIPLYGNKETMMELKKRFEYIFVKTQEGGGKPKVSPNAVKPFEEFNAAGIKVIALPVMHGNLEILGYRIKDFAYITDVSSIPAETYNSLKGLKVLVLDALRHTYHPTHFSLKEAIKAAEKINAEKTFFTHISHAFEHDKTNKTLPRNMELSHDGMEIII